MTRLNLIFFKTPYDDGLVDSIVNYHLNAEDYYSTIEYEPRDVVRKLNQMDNGIFLYYVHSKEDLQEAVSIISAIQKFSHKKFFRFFCVLTYDYTRSESLLKKLGCLGFFTPKENPLKVAKKIDALRKKMLPHLNTFRVEQNEIHYEVDPKQVVTNKTAITSGEPVQFLAALETASDIWIVRSKDSCQNLGEKWQIRLEGPSAHLGKWNEIINQSSSEPTWRFTLMDQENLFFTEEQGFWFFIGERPVYDWREKCWLFQSKFPHLYFQSDFGEEYSRLYLAESILYVAYNSSSALTKEKLILHSAEAKFNVYEFNQLRQEYLSSTLVREFSLESGEVKVNLQYEPNLDDFNLNCEFEDLHAEELLVKAPHEAIHLDAKVRAKVSLDYAGKTADVHCVGTVQEVEKIDHKTDALTISIEMMKQESFQEFLALYQLRQENINDFMTRAKGY